MLASCAIVLQGSFSDPSAARPANRTATSLDDPKYYQRDPNETVITDTGSWSHPVKAVFAKYKLQLNKVELMWNKTFAVFHVKDFGADPGSGPTESFFAPLEFDLAQANGHWAFKLVEDNNHDGFVVRYDAKTRTVIEQLVQDEPP